MFPHIPEAVSLVLELIGCGADVGLGENCSRRLVTRRIWSLLIWVIRLRGFYTCESGVIMVICRNLYALMESKLWKEGKDNFENGHFCTFEVLLVCFKIRSEINIQKTVRTMRETWDLHLHYLDGRRSRRGLSTINLEQTFVVETRQKRKTGT